MKLSCLVLLFAFASTLYAETVPTSRNGFGWDGGIAYRYRFTNTFWASVILSGDVRETKQYDTTIITTHFLSPDSIATTTEVAPDSMKYYSGTVKIEVGKEVFRFNMLDLNAIIFASYNYLNSKTKSKSSFSSNDYSSPRNALSVGLGLEPQVWIADRFSIGTDFGVQYVYTFGNDYRSDNFSSTNGLNSNSMSGVFASQEFKTFGNISLSMGLNALIWF